MKYKLNRFDVSVRARALSTAQRPKPVTVSESGAHHPPGLSLIVPRFMCYHGLQFLPENVGYIDVLVCRRSASDLTIVTKSPTTSLPTTTV